MAGQLGRGVEADLSAHLGELQMGESGEMLIDDIDPVDEKPDVAIITPDDSAEDVEPELQADDCISFYPYYSGLHFANVGTDEAMKAKFLPLVPDLEIETEAISTWSIDNWRALKQKERSPIFQCGGHPWYVRSIRRTPSP